MTSTWTGEVSREVLRKCHSELQQTGKGGSQKLPTGKFFSVLNSRVNY